jgi:2-polyprenyl-3-methyl-5-hydroxy-6-metoxy-1,4-benzoquinol methylase
MRPVIPTRATNSSKMPKSNFAFIEDDIEAIDVVVGQPFDVTFARIVLLHVKDPIRVLHKLNSWTKPSGYIVINPLDYQKAMPQ